MSKVTQSNLILKIDVFFIFVNTLALNDILYEIMSGCIHIFDRPIGDEHTIIKTQHIVRAVG